MPTDKKLKNLVLNVMTEEQYDSATKNEDELYLTPDNTDEIEKVIPTDVGVKDNKLGLVHDTKWLTNQGAINLGEGLIYDEATKTLKASGNASIVIHVGADQKYTTLRAGMETAKTLSEKGISVTVIVHPGTYDLKKEFAAEIAAGITKKTLTGNFIGNNMHVKFMGGAQVYAYFNDASEQKYLTAFYSDNNTDFTLEGANINVSGIGYCLYDKCDTASHTLINCHMVGRCMTSTNNSEVVKIELGTDAYISIQGGIYYHDTYSSSDTQYPIRFVNNSSNIYTTSHIYIDHVNLVKTKTRLDGKGILYFYLPSSGSVWNANIVAMVSNSQMYDVPYMAKGKIEYLGNWNNVYTKPAA